MKAVKEKAYAKLNISLDVTGKRPDGYHEMVMVMQSVSLCDDIEVTLNSGGIKASCNLPFVPCDERNLAVKAAKQYFDCAGLESGGAFIRICKHIPVGSGMGGGSADAAAVLRALDKLHGGLLGREKLEELAASIGSDVAFCVAGGTALATGRGEKLSALPALPDCFVVICKPDFSISTPELFRKLDSVRLRCHPDTAGICAALESGSLAEVARRMYNVFEDVPDRRHSAIGEIKSSLLDLGALGAVMTGTGSAVFGLFDNEDKAKAAREVLGRDYRSCYIAKNVPEV